MRRRNSGSAGDTQRLAARTGAAEFQDRRQPGRRHCRWSRHSRRRRQRGRAARGYRRARWDLCRLFGVRPDLGKAESRIRRPGRAVAQEHRPTRPRVPVRTRQRSTVHEASRASLAAAFPRSDRRCGRDGGCGTTRRVRLGHARQQCARARACRRSARNNTAKRRHTTQVADRRGRTRQVGSGVGTSTSGGAQAACHRRAGGSSIDKRRAPGRECGTGSDARFPARPPTRPPIRRCPAVRTARVHTRNCASEL